MLSTDSQHGVAAPAGRHALARLLGAQRVEEETRSPGRRTRLFDPRLHAGMQQGPQHTPAADHPTPTQASACAAADHLTHSSRQRSLCLRLPQTNSPPSPPKAFLWQHLLNSLERGSQFVQLGPASKLNTSAPPSSSRQAMPRRVSIAALACVGHRGTQSTGATWNRLGRCRPVLCRAGARWLICASGQQAGQRTHPVQGGLMCAGQSTQLGRHLYHQPHAFASVWGFLHARPARFQSACWHAQRPLLILHGTWGRLALLVEVVVMGPALWHRLALAQQPAQYVTLGAGLGLLHDQRQPGKQREG